jgi:hypothetical protein
VVTVPLEQWETSLRSKPAQAPLTVQCGELLLGPLAKTENRAREAVAVVVVTQRAQVVAAAAVDAVARVERAAAAVARASQFSRLPQGSCSKAAH